MGKGEFALLYGFGRVLQRRRNVLSLKSGKSARISSVQRPAASWPSTLATGILKPRMQGTPRILVGSTVIRSNSIAS